MKVYHELVLEAMEALDVPRHLADAIGRSAGEVGTCLARLVLYSVAPMLDATSVGEIAERLGLSDDTVLRQLDRGHAKKWARTIRKQGRKMLRTVQEAVRSMSPASQSRYRVTYAIDDFAAGKRSETWRTVAPLFSGAEKRVLSGVSLVTFVAVIGDRKLLIPLGVEFKKPRRPGPGRPPLTKLDIAERMMEDFLIWARKQNLGLECGLWAADSWYINQHMIGAARRFEVPLIGEPKRNWVFMIDGHRRKTPAELLESSLPLKPSARGEKMPLRRYRATHKLFGEVVLVVYEIEEGGKLVRKCLMCTEIGMEGHRIVSAWKRRWGVEQFHWSLKQTFALCNERFSIEHRYQTHVALRVLGCGLAHFLRWLSPRKWRNVPELARDFAENAAQWIPAFFEGLTEALAISAAPADKALRTGTH
jgi:hypothetical protein